MSQLCQQQEKILDVLALLVAQKDQTTKRPTSSSGSSATALNLGTISHGPVSHFQAYHPLNHVHFHTQGPPLLLNHQVSHPSVSRHHFLHPLLSPLVCPLHSQIQPLVSHGPVSHSPVSHFQAYHPLKIVIHSHLPFASSRPLQSGHTSSLPAHPYSSGRTFRHSQTGQPLSSNPVFQEQTLSSGQVILTEQPSHSQGNLRPHLMQQQPCSTLMSGTAHAEYSPTPAFSDDFDFDWTGSDSDYLTSQSGDPETQWSTPVAYSSRDSSLSRSEPFASPSDVECVEIISSSSSEASRGVRPSQPALSKTIPQPPFKTPPKLRTVEQVMHNYSGTGLAALRKLTTALAREAIFGREALVKLSLS